MLQARYTVGNPAAIIAALPSVEGASMARRALARSALFFAIVVGCSGVEQGSTPPPADLVLRNGGIYTVDAQRTWAHAAAIRDGVLVAVGDDATVAPYVGPGTRVVDLTGHMALP